MKNFFSKRFFIALIALSTSVISPAAAPTTTASSEWFTKAQSLSTNFDANHIVSDGLDATNLLLIHGTPDSPEHSALATQLYATVETGLQGVTDLLKEGTAKNDGGDSMNFLATKLQEIMDLLHKSPFQKALKATDY